MTLTINFANKISNRIRCLIQPFLTNTPSTTFYQLRFLSNKTNQNTTLELINSNKLNACGLYKSFASKICVEKRLFNNKSFALSDYDNKPTSSSSSAPDVDDNVNINRMSSGLYYFNVHATLNNTIVSFSTEHNQLITCCSGGMCGFKKAKRAGHEPGYQAALRVINTIKQMESNTNNTTINAQNIDNATIQKSKFEKNKGTNSKQNKTISKVKEVIVKFIGFGPGRDAAYQALRANTEWKIKGVCDCTPIPFNGCRPRKRRRI